jgi:hypothetical protein
VKKTKKHFLRTLAAAAEEEIEEAIAKASGYASAEVMRVALAKALFNNPQVKRSLVAMHKKAQGAANAMAKPKPRARDISKLRGRVQAPRLQPRRSNEA